MSASNILSRFDRLVDFFIPETIAADRDRRHQARLFLISHILGPFIGNTVPLALYIFDPNPSWSIPVLALAISSFWLYPPVLKFAGHYEVLAILSIQNLIFCIFWSCYFYGGVMSPTLPWVLTIPLLAFFYIGDSATLRLMFLLLFAVNSMAFCVVYFFVYAPVSHIPAPAMQGLGLTSTIAAALYVTMMALYYARALASQVELESLSRRHMATAAELQRAAAVAERASVAKAEFLARMSHELRTPLNAVIGYSQILLENAEENDRSEDIEDISLIHEAGQHLLSLVNDVLDLSKIEAGRMETYNEAVDLAGLVRSVAEEMSSFAKRNNNRLEVSVDAGVSAIVGDAMKIQSALRQVVDNAIKYTKDGRVSITCSPARGGGRECVDISVEDTGIGISPDHIPYLFEQFAVLDDQTSTKYGGTGLGLALARKITRLMGGDVSVTTELGRGSRFVLTIPRAAPPGLALCPP